MRRVARALPAALPVALAALALACSAGDPVTADPPRRAAGPVVDLTVEPAMAKGPAGAPVTIVEFSDYQ